MLQRLPRVAKVEMMLPLMVAPLPVLADTFPTSLPTLECISGVALASVTMRLCFWLKL